MIGVERRACGGRGVSGDGMRAVGYGRLAVACLTALLLAGCGSSGGSGSSSNSSAGGGSTGTGGSGTGGGTGTGTGGGTVPADVTVSGLISYDYVPVLQSFGLDYAHTSERPARGVTVQMLASSGNAVLATTTTDTSGHYAMTVPSQTQAFVRVEAEIVQDGSPAWNYRVADNTNGDALYVLDGTAFDTGTADSTHDLNAASGWGGSSYTSTRSAAPFAILDTVYEATQFVLKSDPGLTFPPLVLHWSPSNTPSLNSNNTADPTTGEIGSSYFAYNGSARDIYLLGDADNDTDEYDQHVVWHEWGHYFADAFSRDDSIGGPHTRGDELDMRVAFGEGWANAFSGMPTDDSVYVDTQGYHQQKSFSFDLETPASANPHPGWYSEESVQEIVYGIYDPNTSAPYALALGFAPIYDVMTQDQRNTLALTSIFPFVHGLKMRLPSDASNISNMVTKQSIDPVMDDYGGNQTSNAGDPASPDILPIYRDATVNGSAVNVCSTDAFSSSSYTDGVNKLGSRQFVKFTAAAGGSYTMTAKATSVPSGHYADPDMVLHHAGPIAISDGPPDKTACTAATPLNCHETFTKSLSAGDYVLEVYEWTNTNRYDDPQYPPIGKTCFDVSVAGP
jgi:hypothetical protein